MPTWNAYVAIGYIGVGAPTRTRLLAHVAAWIACLPLLVSCTVYIPPPQSAQPVPPPPRAVTNVAPTVRPIVRAALSGSVQNLGGYYEVHPDCSPGGIPTLRVVTPPNHGTITFEKQLGYTNYPKDNQRYECNKLKSPEMQVLYHSEPGYLGPDNVVIEVIFTDGVFRQETYSLAVK
jgi:hypothetical protein